MSKLRIMIHHEAEKPARRRFRFQTEMSQKKTPKLHSPEKYFQRLKGPVLASTSHEKDEKPTSQLLKDKLFHRNFSQYKQIFQAQNNVESLPFIVTLRQSKQHKFDNCQAQPTVLQPFEVAQKLTLNQKIKKDVSSIDANKTRAYQASYRWRKRSGIQVRVSCEFQSGLRESNQKKSVEQSNFKNYIKPTRYKNIESKRYNLKDLICQHQKKVFELQNP